MGVLEKVTQMRQQGQTESQIIDSLRKEGVSPKEIEQALSQSKIKSALTRERTMTRQMQQPTYDMTAEIPPQTQMQPSMMQTQEPQMPYPEEQSYTQFPQTQELQQVASSFQPSTMAVETPAYSQDYYPEYAPEATNIETINEIADQIVEEKISNLRKQISSFTRFKEDLSLEIEKMNERLLKIENTLSQLQIAIVGKIGEYGKDIKNIAKEMHSTQDSFSKILNPLTDNIRELQKLTGNTSITSDRPKTTKSKSQKSQISDDSQKSKRFLKKEKINFEDYLR